METRPISDNGKWMLLVLITDMDEAWFKNTNDL